MTKSDHEYIVDKSLVEPEAFGIGAAKGDKITFNLLHEEIEYIQGFIAAEANHAKSKKMEKELDRLFDLLQAYLDK
jgi:hypothetical protein